MLRGLGGISGGSCSPIFLAGVKLVVQLEAKGVLGQNVLKVLSPLAPVDHEQEAARHSLGRCLGPQIGS